MKLLISSYACAPHRGSEHAVGWNWITQAHLAGHEVHALVAPNHRDSVTQACARLPELAGITWHFPAVPFWPLRQAVEPAWERTYNCLWQISILSLARRLHASVRFDAIHHLTWGGIRAMTFLGTVGAPLILGPVGGGETSPRSLRDGFHAKARITAAIRDFSTRTIMLHPLVRPGLVQASLLVTKTPDTSRLFRGKMRAKVIEYLELGLQKRQSARPPRAPGPPRLLFAGRLLYWKGAHIAIRAFAELRHEMPDARLTVVGDGPERQRLQALAHDLSGNVDFLPWIAQADLFELYRSHDLLVFPSMNDSSGNVVLEALSFGLPVVCLDIAGPAQIVTKDSGILIETSGRDTAQVAKAMGAAMAEILRRPDRLAELSAGAVARAADFSLPDRVARFYEFVERSIAQPGTADAKLSPSLSASAAS